MEPAKPFRIWPYLLINFVAACWLDLTRFHQLLTSDSIVFVLASLYEMRVFFWEQDRIGMLVPLLASWCNSPFHNLLLQTATMIFIGLTMPVMLARVLTPHRMAPLAITLLNAAFLLLAPDKLHENWMLVCNYPSALLLGFCAISVVDSRPLGESWAKRTLRFIGCAVLMILAHWQYFGVVLYLGLDRRYEHLAHHDFVFSRDAEEEFDFIYKRGEPAPDPTCYLAAPSGTLPPRSLGFRQRSIPTPPHSRSCAKQLLS